MIALIITTLAAGWASVVLITVSVCARTGRTAREAAL